MTSKVALTASALIGLPLWNSMPSAKSDLRGRGVGVLLPRFSESRLGVAAVTLPTPHQAVPHADRPPLGRIASADRKRSCGSAEGLGSGGIGRDDPAAHLRAVVRLLSLGDGCLLLLLLLHGLLLRLFLRLLLHRLLLLLLLLLCLSGRRLIAVVVIAAAADERDGSCAKTCAG